MKTKHFIILTVLLLSLTGCTSEKEKVSSTQPSSAPAHQSSSEISTKKWIEADIKILDKYVESFDKYSYNGELEVTKDDRHFKLDDTPENIPEELVAYRFYYDIVGEYDKLCTLYCSLDRFQAAPKKIKQRYDEGTYLKEATITELSIIKKEIVFEDLGVIAQTLTNDVYNFELTEFTIVKVKKTEANSDTFDEWYLCGKSEDENEYKIYTGYVK